LTEFIQNYLLDGSLDWIVTPEIHRKLKRIEVRYTDRANLLGRLGEQFVADNLHMQFQSRGLHYSYKKEPLSYYMKYQYTPYRSGRRYRTGIDVYARLVDEDNNSYRVMLEISNWRGKYHSINNHIFEQRILSKFLKYDALNRNIRCLAMNRRNIRLIEDRCKIHNIHILPIREHITPELLNRIYKENLIKDEYQTFSDL